MLGVRRGRLRRGSEVVEMSSASEGNVMVHDELSLLFGDLKLSY